MKNARWSGDGPFVSSENEALSLGAKGFEVAELDDGQHE